VVSCLPMGPPKFYTEGHRDVRLVGDSGSGGIKTFLIPFLGATILINQGTLICLIHSNMAARSPLCEDGGDGGPWKRSLGWSSELNTLQKVSTTYGPLQGSHNG
jgi:hypothetical protein